MSQVALFFRKGLVVDGEVDGVVPGRFLKGTREPSTLLLRYQKIPLFLHVSQCIGITNQERAEMRDSLKPGTTIKVKMRWLTKPDSSGERGVVVSQRLAYFERCKAIGNELVEQVTPFSHARVLDKTESLITLDLGEGFKGVLQKSPKYAPDFDRLKPGDTVEVFAVHAESHNKLIVVQPPRELLVGTGTSFSSFLSAGY